MNLFYNVFIFLLLVGGGLLIVFRCMTKDPKLDTALTLLLSIAGAGIALYGLYLQFNDLPPVEASRGVISGWQYVWGGGILCVACGYSAVKKIRGTN